MDGAPEYMAPEALQCKPAKAGTPSPAPVKTLLTTAADIRSMGCMLYEILKGRHLFEEGEVRVQLYTNYCHVFSGCEHVCMCCSCPAFCPLCLGSLDWSMLHRLEHELEVVQKRALCHALNGVNIALVAQERKYVAGSLAPSDATQLELWQQADDLLICMLQSNPSQRVTASQVSEHRFCV